jgi:hypothetical protein
VKSLQKKLQVFRNLTFMVLTLGLLKIEVFWDITLFLLVMATDYSQEHSASKTFVIIDHLTYIISQNTEICRKELLVMIQMPASSSCMMQNNIEDNIRVDLTKTHRVFAHTLLACFRMRSNGMLM